MTEHGYRLLAERETAIVMQAMLQRHRLILILRLPIPRNPQDPKSSDLQKLAEDSGD